MSELARRVQALNLDRLRRRWVLAEILLAPPSARWKPGLRPGPPQGDPQRTPEPPPDPTA